MGVVNIRQSATVSEDLTASAADCLVGKYAIFADSDDEVVQGTIPDSTDSSKTYTCNSTNNTIHTITKGYHDGTEVIKVNPIEATTANAKTTLKNKTIYVSDGSGSISKITGTIGLG